jgi:uncharacterized protein
VLIKSRQASDLLGATKMDRPEWIAIDQDARTVYCTLTNNSRRGMPDRPAVDAANPRASNNMGHIIQWTEAGDFDATALRWQHLLLAGDPANERPEARGNMRLSRRADPGPRHRHAKCGGFSDAGLRPDRSAAKSPASR